MKKLLSILLLVSINCVSQTKTTRVIHFGKRTIKVFNGGAGSSSPAPTDTTTNGRFSFTVVGTKSVSAGVYKNDSILVTTLWNNETFTVGSYYAYWDGKDDYGNTIAPPASTYKVKVLTNNVQYQWQGTIGNTSDNMTGATKHRSTYQAMKGIAFAATFGYFCTGYSEGLPSIGKFNINTPNQRIDLTTNGSKKADNNYVATDGNYVYWGAYDSNLPNNSFVYATSTSNDADVIFTSGISYALTFGANYNVISYQNTVNGLISGLAVQKTGSYLFVARKDLNQVQVLNKGTGALVWTLTYTTPRGLSIDGSDNLWMASGTNTVSKYTVNGDGSLTAATLTLSGLLAPQATQVSADGTLISVADGSTSQQVKFFNNTTGAATTTLGVAGGYSTDATVNDNKFYFNDVNGAGINQYNKLPFIAFQSDGSYWVGDPGNFRVQHYNSANIYINRLMWLGANYNVFADKNNISKVFVEFLEFEIDYSVQTLTGTSGWKLKKSWGANISTSLYDGSPRYETTLSNSRTYGFIRKGNNWEVIEFPAIGQLRFTGIILNGLGKILCSDGSLQDYSTVGSTATLTRFPLTGYDGIGNPIWSGTGELLATGTTDHLIGSPIEYQNSQVFGSTNKVVFFNPKAFANNVGPVYSTGYHLGLMQKGANNTFLFQTEKSTHRNYSGDYPQPGWFDVGNLVNDNAGSTVNIIDRNIITSYHGEFWKNSQTNKFNHYYDDGLAIGQFGITGPEMTGPATAMLAGNALTPVLVKDNNGDLYLWHGDESQHSAVHRWKITGLNTISEQVITIPFPSAYTPPPITYINLMAGLPFDAVLANNTAGWTRTPTANNEGSPYDSLWRVNTSRISYDRLNDNDVSVEALIRTATANLVTRNLGTNSVTNNWKITGKIAYSSDNNVNNGTSQQFLEVLDATGKVLVKFFVTGSYQAPTYIYGNSAQIATASNRVIEREITKTLPFEVRIVNGTVTFTYGSYAVVSTTISDASGNWQTPKTLQLRFTGAGGGGFKQMISVQDFKFYKDYL